MKAIAIPTDIEGEVLAYRYHDDAHHVVVRIPGQPANVEQPEAWEFRIPPDDVFHFDCIPSRELYDDGTPGATVRLTFDTVAGRILTDRFVEIMSKGNAPGAPWMTKKIAP